LFFGFFFKRADTFRIIIIIIYVIVDVRINGLELFWGGFIIFMEPSQ